MLELLDLQSTQAWIEEVTGQAIQIQEFLIEQQYPLSLALALEDVVEQKVLTQKALAEQAMKPWRGAIARTWIEEVVVRTFDYEVRAAVRGVAGGVVGSLAAEVMCRLTARMTEGVLLAETLWYLVSGGKSMKECCAVLHCYLSVIGCRVIRSIGVQPSVVYSDPRLSHFRYAFQGLGSGVQGQFQDLHQIIQIP